MQVNSTQALMLAIIERAMVPDRNGLDTWARRVFVGSDGLFLVPFDEREEAQPVTGQVVARGIWRVKGGQNKDRPVGFTEEMADQLSRALSDMDADELDPATASATIQVGLYREVLYRHA